MTGHDRGAGPFDPNDPAFLADPYQVFAALREQAAVHFHPGLGERGMHVVLTHAGCDAVLRERGLGRIWRDRESAEQFPAFNLLHQTSILESEPPTHTRLRRRVARRDRRHLALKDGQELSGHGRRRSESPDRRRRAHRDRNNGSRAALERA